MHFKFTVILCNKRIQDMNYLGSYWVGSLQLVNIYHMYARDNMAQ